MFNEIIFHDVDIEDISMNVTNLNGFNPFKSLSIRVMSESALTLCIYNNIIRFKTDMYFDIVGCTVINSEISKTDPMLVSYLNTYKTDANSVWIQELNCYIIETTSGIIKFITGDKGEFITIPIQK